jgi:hypothetical protein
MAADVVNGALLSRAHPVLDLGEGLFDRIEVGRVWRQIPEPCAGSFNEAAQRSRLVTAEVVHNDDVAWLKLRDENLLNIGAEAFAVDWAGSLRDIGGRPNEVCFTPQERTFSDGRGVSGSCRFCSLIPGLGVKLSNDRPLPGPLFSPR